MCTTLKYTVFVRSSKVQEMSINMYFFQVSADNGRPVLLPCFIGQSQLYSQVQNQQNREAHSTHRQILLREENYYFKQKPKDKSVCYAKNISIISYFIEPKF